MMLPINTYTKTIIINTIVTNTDTIILSHIDANTIIFTRTLGDKYAARDRVLLAIHGFICRGRPYSMPCHHKLSTLK